jgi:hypothetical protein
VTAIVPEELTVNDRLLCPPGATVLDHVSLIVAEVLLGVVEVLSSPQPATSSVAIISQAITSHGDAEVRRPNLFLLRALLRASVPP